MSSDKPAFVNEHGEYFIHVRFSRTYADDVKYVTERMKTGLSPEEALRQQFIAELQEAYDLSGMPGNYELVLGPVGTPGRVVIKVPARE